MSTHTISWDATASVLELYTALVGAGQRTPESVRLDDGTLTATYTPDLTAAELTAIRGVVADLVSATHTRRVEFTFNEYEALKPKLAEIRTFRTRTLAAWNALTATQREADQLGYLNDLTDVLRALLRDG